VFPNLAQGVVIVVIGRDIFGSFMLLVEECLRGNVFRAYGTDPADGVVIRIRHAGEVIAGEVLRAQVMMRSLLGKDFGSSVQCGSVGSALLQGFSGLREVQEPEIIKSKETRTLVRETEMENGNQHRAVTGFSAVG
jgi:hypothetical protein